MLIGLPDQFSKRATAAATVLVIAICDREAAIGTVSNCLFGSRGDLDLVGTTGNDCGGYLPDKPAIICGFLGNPLVVPI